MEKTTITVTKEIKDKLNIMKYRSGFSNMSKLIENKIFTPFCIFCGSKEKLENHHVSYDDEFTIRLCKNCHVKFDRHKKNNMYTIKRDVICNHCGHNWMTKSIGKKVCCPSCLYKVIIDKEADLKDKKSIPTVSDDES